VWKLTIFGKEKLLYNKFFVVCLQERVSVAVAVADSLGCCHDTCDIPDILCLCLAPSVLHGFVGALQSVCSVSSGASPKPFTTSFAQENFLHSYGVRLMLLAAFTKQNMLHQSGSKSFIPLTKGL